MKSINTKYKYVIFVILCVIPFTLYARKVRTWCNPFNISYRYNISEGGFREAADPSIVYYKGKYWLFASKSGGYWWSENLYDWQFVASTRLPVEDYAPTAVEYEGKLYFLASFSTLKPMSLYRTSDPMDGDNWEAVPTSVFRCTNLASGNQYIDPMLYSEGKKLFLYWGCSNKNPIYVTQLDPEKGFQAMTDAHDVISSDTLHHGWEYFPKGGGPWIEGGWCNAYKGKYYLQYAAPGTSLDWYCDSYAVSDSPDKGFRTDAHSPLSLKSTGFARGAGHGSSFEDVSHQYWHVATNCLSVKAGFERRLSIYPMVFDAEGVPYCSTLWGDYPQYRNRNKSKNIEDLFTGWMLLSYGKEISASSELPGHEVRNAFDENMRTYWCANGVDGQWVKIDLGSIEDVYAVQMNFADHDSRLKGRVDDISYHYQIYSSRDEKNWKLLVDRSKENRDMPHDYIELPHRHSTRFLKFKALSVPDGSLAVSGFRVFGLGHGNCVQAVDCLTINRDKQNRCKARLSWIPQIHATGYVVKYGVEAQKLYQSMIVYGDSEIDTRLLNANEEYYFSIAAFNDQGVSDYTIPIHIP